MRPPRPEPCEHEGMTANRGAKSRCDAWGLWTNCREVGWCVWKETKSKPEQLALFELDGMEEE